MWGRGKAKSNRFTSQPEHNSSPRRTNCLNHSSKSYNQKNDGAPWKRRKAKQREGEARKGIFLILRISRDRPRFQRVLSNRSEDNELAHLKTGEGNISVSTHDLNLLKGTKARGPWNGHMKKKNSGELESEEKHGVIGGQLEKKKHSRAVRFSSEHQ